MLGLPPDAPLNLWSLLDPETPDAKPQYNYHVLVKLAILGNKGQKATLQDILRAIRMRFPYYDKLSKQEAIAFGNSIRHLLSLLAAFVREPKPVTEPGKGAYWRVDFSKGEGNKRVRKRNKPQKKS
ncbi:winged helix DNA-binding domain-containing protein, partial [Fomitiporia mediterranea MF3/22]|uniref:winged helix DNA-binding domain-containing protein n=1 Tax=Fomitiporia mediterranea (strain MF3/22) TaxID=694068 RepID=UPI00044079AA